MTLQNIQHVVAIEVDEATNLVTLYQDTRTVPLSAEQCCIFETYISQNTAIDLSSCVLVVQCVDSSVESLVA